jgi:glycyl-tRNA synthetase
MMGNALVEEAVGESSDGEGNTRDVLKLHPALSPLKFAVMPLKRNEPGLVKKAKGIFHLLKFHFPGQYDDTGSIGKLYRRQDAIGTPFCITVDFETLENDTVTIRERDSMAQQRVSISALEDMIRKEVDMARLFK